MNKEEIIEGIRELKKEKVDLFDYRYLRSNYASLYREGKQKFGSWKKAVNSSRFSGVNINDLEG